MLGLLGLAAGLAGGYKKNQMHEREQARQDKQDAWQEEQRDALRQDRQQQMDLKNGLRDAAAPATMAPVEGSVLPEDQAGPSLALYKVKGNGINQTTNDQAQATQSLANYNAPDAVGTRQASAYRAAGMPDKAMTLDNAMVDRKRSDEKYAQDNAERARKLKDEGVFDALRAFRAGDAGGLVKAFNAGGEYKLEGAPEVVKEDRELAGVGKVPSYTAKMRIIGPDGQVQEKTYNSHDLTMQLMDPIKAWELQRKGTDSDNKGAYQGALLDTKIKQLELTGKMAEARALKASANGGPVGREERIRYTSLFSDAGRRLGETQKALGVLQGKALFMSEAKNPDSPEAGQLRQLQDSIKAYSEERSLYQGLLAGSQTPSGKPEPAAASLTPPAAKPIGVASNGRPPLSNFNR